MFAQQREKFETVNPIYHEYLPLENGEITYSEVVPVENVDKDELFVRANEWIVKSFNSSKDVIQFNDKEAGRIVCKTLTTLSAGKGMSAAIMEIHYLITIETRDGRYRIAATDFIHHYSVKVGQITNEGENRLEQYFLLKEPKKKELEMNMELARKLSTFIEGVFFSAEASISETKDDDW